MDFKSVALPCLFFVTRGMLTAGFSRICTVREAVVRLSASLSPDIYAANADKRRQVRAYNQPDKEIVREYIMSTEAGCCGIEGVRADVFETFRVDQCGAHVRHPDWCQPSGSTVGPLI